MSAAYAGAKHCLFDLGWMRSKAASNTRISRKGAGQKPDLGVLRDFEESERRNLLVSSLQTKYAHEGGKSKYAHLESCR